MAKYQKIDYTNPINNYLAFVYTDGLSPVLVDQVQQVRFTIRRDKMPVFSFGGDSNKVSIVRRSRLVSGTFLRSLSNLQDLQKLLLDNIDADSNFPAVYEFVRESMTLEQLKTGIADILGIDKNDDLNATDSPYSEWNKFINSGDNKTALYNDEDTGLTAVKRPPIRLSDFNGANLVLVGFPEHYFKPASEDISGQLGSSTDFFQNLGNNSTVSNKNLNGFIYEVKDIQFVSNLTNLSVDNPDLVEQVDFYGKNIRTRAISSESGQTA